MGGGKLRVAEGGGKQGGGGRGAPLAVGDGVLSAGNDGAEIRFLSPAQAARSRLNTPPALKSQLSPPPLWSTRAP